MLLTDITVEVRNKALERVGMIRPEDLVLKVEELHNNIGSWTLELPTEHVMVPHLRTPGAGIIVTGPAGILFSGPTTATGSTTSSSDPEGSLIFDGVTDTVHLADRACYPDPSNPNAATQTLSHDVRSGRAESVMHAYVRANLGPGAPADRRHSRLTMGTDNARGPIITKSARFQVLGELLNEIATGARLGFRIVQRGTSLVFETFSISDLTTEVRLDVLNGTLNSSSTEITAPGATHVIIAGQGELTERQFYVGTNPAAQTAGAEWGRRIERFVDQRQTEDSNEHISKANEILEAEGHTGVGMRVTPGDDTEYHGMRFARDWNLGDEVTVVVVDEERRATVTGYILIVDEQGVRVGATIGQTLSFDKEAAINKQVSSNTSRIDSLERNSEVAMIVPVSRGGTGGKTPAEARTALEVPGLVHNHSASNLTSGTVPVARMPYRLDRGFKFITPTPNEVSSVDVKFTTPFSNVPDVVATANTGVPGEDVVAYSVSLITVDGFRLNLFRKNNVSTALSWIAVGS